MKAKNQFEKYKYYLEKRGEIFFHGLGKSQLLGRKIGPKVVLNSLPKSGTHLLESLFFQLPLMRHCGKRTLKIQTQDPIIPNLKHISSLKKGQFLLAHMQFHSSILERSKSNNIKIVHLVRDPRDVLISHLNYIQNMDITHKSHSFISQFERREDKLKAMIEGKANVLEPFSEVLDKFLPWTLKEEVLSVKFEDLIGEKGGGTLKLQKKCIKEICKFIAIEIEIEQLTEISKTVYSPKSSTFNKGKIGNWKHILNDNEKMWINKALKNQIIEYGYQ